MSLGVRSVSDLVNGLRNNKLTVHHATLRSHGKAFISFFFKSIALAYSPIEECSIGIAVNKERLILFDKCIVLSVFGPCETGIYFYHGAMLI